jgi:hypothetical protein
MTVKQLIQILSTIEDQDVRVMTRGYEGGYNDINVDTPTIQYMALNVNDEWYYGDHEKVEDIMEQDKDRYHIIKAIVL